MMKGRKDRKGQRDRQGETSGVNQDLRYQEPLGPGVAWGHMEQLGGKYAGIAVPITRQIFIIGRQSDCDIIVDNDLASRYHALVTWDHDRGYLRDNHSTNGTRVNGQAGLGVVLLRHGDIIEVAGAEFRFSYSEASGLAVLESQPTEKFSLPGIVPPENRTQVRAHLRALTGPEPGRVWPVLSGVITIGRGGDNLVVLAHASVSRHHAQILVQPTGIYVLDLGSSNRTSVNGEALIAPRLLQNGDHLQIGDVLLVCTIEEGVVGIPPEDQPTQQLPMTMPGPAQRQRPIPPFQGAITRPGGWRNATPAPPQQPAPSQPGAQFRPPPPTRPVPPEGERRMPRFHTPGQPDDESKSG